MFNRSWRGVACAVPFGFFLACGGGADTNLDPASPNAVGGMSAGSAPPQARAGASSGNAANRGGSANAAGMPAGGSSSSAGGSSTTNGGVPTAGGMQPSTADGTAGPENTPQGYGKETTGGGNGKVVSVDTVKAMQDAIDAYESGGLVLKYTGKFDFKTITDPCVQHTLPAQTVEIKEKSDISILGEPGSSANFGIHIASTSRNIIIRNMTIGLTPGGDASDIVSVEGMSKGAPKDIWIDHNEFFTSLAKCAGAGDTAFDGMIDVKKGADNITVSYNYLHDHHKVSLNGYTDDDDQVRHITFHHNLFENIGSRAPLQRHGYAHVFNNYFLGVSASCVNVRMGGYALVEANYFEKVVNPVTARDSDAVGFWDLRANNLQSAADVGPGNKFGISWSSGDAGTVNATDWKTTAAYPVALGYEYDAQPFQCIHDGLRAAAGAGKALATLKCK